MSTLDPEEVQGDTRIVDRGGSRLDDTRPPYEVPLRPSLVPQGCLPHAHPSPKGESDTREVTPPCIWNGL